MPVILSDKLFDIISLDELKECIKQAAEQTFQKADSIARDGKEKGLSTAHLAAVNDIKNHLKLICKVLLRDPDKNAIMDFLISMESSTEKKYPQISAFEEYFYVQLNNHFFGALKTHVIAKDPAYWERVEAEFVTQEEKAAPVNWEKKLKGGSLPIPANPSGAEDEMICLDINIASILESESGYEYKN